MSEFFVVNFILKPCDSSHVEGLGWLLQSSLKKRMLLF